MQSAHRFATTGVSALGRGFTNKAVTLTGPRLMSMRRSIVTGVNPNFLPRHVPSQLVPKNKLFGRAAGALLAACAVGQYYYGNQTEFFDYRFITDKDPDDLAGFYGSENFMDIFCVLPLMGTLMMRGGYFDEEGTVHTTGFPGEMLVSMVFSDEMNEDGAIKWFNKRERFRDVCCGFTCWDMVTNFGFSKLPDGRTMVYHHGEYFMGSLPPFSLLVRIVFGIHARWVAWAAEHHINHYAFQNETEVDEEMEKESREDMPLFVLKNYAWSDLMAGLFGRKIEKPSFLIQRSREAAAQFAEETEANEDSSKGEERENMTLPSREELLPFQNPAIMRRITHDIKVDRRNSKITLAVVHKEQETDEPVLAKRATVKERIDMDIALDHHLTVHRKLTSSAAKGGEAEPFVSKQLGDALRRHVTTLQCENMGSNFAWEALRSTNNPKAYKAATLAASERFLQRRATAKAMAPEEQQELIKQTQEAEQDSSSIAVAQDKASVGVGCGTTRIVKSR